MDVGLVLRIASAAVGVVGIVGFLSLGGRCWRSFHLGRIGRG